MKRTGKMMAAVLFLGATLLTGCSVEQRMVINSDFSSTVDMDMYTTSAEEQEILKSLAEMGSEDMTYEELMESMEFSYVGTKEIDGASNNIYTSKETMSAKETKDSFLELTKNRAVYNISEQSETATQQMSGNSSVNYGDMGFFYMTITYPFKVGKANGDIQADGYTVKYDILDLQKKKVPRIYAISKSSLASADKITVKGVKNKKAYKKAVTLKVSAKSGIVSFKVNGKDQAVNAYYAKKSGKYVAEIESATGKTKKISFCVDKKKPVTNIKNKKTYKKTIKITFRDDISGIKKATLNGKKIKSGKKVKKNGNYTLKIYDKAGNVKTVKFTIKK